ncbi:hypothetical protein AT5A_19841 [Agrobacterium tumefaciens 5A]|nr:hypothetical protein AT5A_19841 [Agrobacterium tumefaciens 5A]
MAAEIMRASGFTRLLPRQELFVVWSDPFNCVARDVYYFPEAVITHAYLRLSESNRQSTIHL